MPSTSQLQAAANQIKSETVPRANTATRVGQMLLDLVQYLIDNPGAAAAWGSIAAGAGVDAQSDLVAYITNRLINLVIGNPANQEPGEQITALPFYTSAGGGLYLFGVRWQDDEDNPLEELVVSYDGGSTWKTVAELGATPPFSVFFTSSTRTNEGFSSYAAAAARVQEEDTTLGIATLTDLNAPRDEDDNPAPFYLPNGPLCGRDFGTDGQTLEISPVGNFFDLDARHILLNGGVVKMSADYGLPSRLRAVRVDGEVRVSVSSNPSVVQVNELFGFINLLYGASAVFTGHLQPPVGESADYEVLRGDIGTVYLKNASIVGKIAPGITIVDLDRRGRSTPVDVTVTDGIMDLTAFDDTVEVVRVTSADVVPCIQIVSYASQGYLRITCAPGIEFQIAPYIRDVIDGQGRLVGADGNNYPIAGDGAELGLRPVTVENGAGSWRCFAVDKYYPVD